MFDHVGSLLCGRRDAGEVGWADAGGARSPFVCRPHGVPCPTLLGGRQPRWRETSRAPVGVAPCGRGRRVAGKSGLPREAATRRRVDRRSGVGTGCLSAPCRGRGPKGSSGPASLFVRVTWRTGRSCTIRSVAQEAGEAAAAARCLGGAEI